MGNYECQNAVVQQIEEREKLLDNRSRWVKIGQDFGADVLMKKTGLSIGYRATTMR